MSYEIVKGSHIPDSHIHVFLLNGTSIQPGRFNSTRSERPLPLPPYFTINALKNIDCV